MNENSVNQKTIDVLIDNAETQECVFWNKELVISYKLPNGFTVLGRSACVDPDNFDLDVGRILCKENATHKVWELEGYKTQLLMSGEIELI